MSIAICVFWVAMMGILYLLDTIPAPRTWSLCSCVMSIASISCGLTSMAVSSLSKFFPLIPQSTSSLVSPEEMNVQFPDEPLISEQKFVILISNVCFVTNRLAKLQVLFYTSSTASGPPSPCYGKALGSKPQCVYVRIR